VTWFHIHSWRTVSAQRLRLYDGEQERPVDHQTITLQRCTRCGKNRTGRVDGHWTVGQLNGVTE
jgi:hypothetical protein